MQQRFLGTTGAGETAAAQQCEVVQWVTPAGRKALGWKEAPRDRPGLAPGRASPQLWLPPGPHCLGEERSGPACALNTSSRLGRSLCPSAPGLGFSSVWGQRL